MQMLLNPSPSTLVADVGYKLFGQYSKQFHKSVKIVDLVEKERISSILPNVDVDLPVKKILL